MNYENEDQSKAFIQILAEGFKSASQVDVQSAVTTAVMNTIQKMDLNQTIRQLLEPVVKAEFARLSESDEFKKIISEKVTTAIRGARLELRNY